MDSGEIISDVKAHFDEWRHRRAAEKAMHDEQKFLGALPPSETISNQELQKQLSWPDGLYDDVKQRLLNNGKIETGQGGGHGTVRRVISQVSSQPTSESKPEPNYTRKVAPTSRPTTPESAPKAKAAPKHLNTSDVKTPKSSKYPDEDSLYDDMGKSLESWRTHKTDKTWISTKADKRIKTSHGTKSQNPDITLVTVTKAITGTTVELETFEVKHYEKKFVPIDAANECQGHYESFANKSWILLYLPDAARPDWEYKIKETKTHAIERKIGFIIADNPAEDSKNWEIVVDAGRHERPSEDQHDFIEKFFTPDQAREIERHRKS